MSRVYECGGCVGLGRHRRWCPEVVGRTASMLGTLSEQAESLGDQIGPNLMAAANHCYAAAGMLKAEAEDAAAEFAARTVEDVAQG